MENIEKLNEKVKERTQEGTMILQTTNTAKLPKGKYEESLKTTERNSRVIPGLEKNSK